MQRFPGGRAIQINDTRVLSSYLVTLQRSETENSLVVVMDEPGLSAAGTSGTGSLPSTTTASLPIEDVRRIAQEVASIISRDVRYISIY